MHLSSSYFLFLHYWVNFLGMDIYNLVSVLDTCTSDNCVVSLVYLNISLLSLLAVTFVTQAQGQVLGTNFSIYFDTVPSLSNSDMCSHCLSSSSSLVFRIEVYHFPFIPPSKISIGLSCVNWKTQWLRSLAETFGCRFWICFSQTLSTTWVLKGNETVCRHTVLTDLHTGRWVRRSNHWNIPFACTWWCCWRPTDTCRIQLGNLQQQPYTFK